MIAGVNDQLSSAHGNMSRKQTWGSLFAKECEKTTRLSDETTNVPKVQYKNIHDKHRTTEKNRLTLECK